MLTHDSTNPPSQDPPVTARELYSSTLNEWLANNGDAPTLGDPGWRAHEIGLEAVAAAAQAEVLESVRAGLSTTVGPVNCDADEKGTFLEGMLRMRQSIEAELDALVVRIRAAAPVAGEVTDETRPR